jgi:rubrerythrin
MNTAIRTGMRPPQRPNPCAIGDPDAGQSARLRALGALVWVVAALVAGAWPVRAEEGATLAALEIAYGREQNAHAHRLAYAAAAEREGHCEAACLFRASAAAESLHAARIGAAIERLDARPGWTLSSVVVQGTADNLKACLEREIDERDRVYARFARYAREECLYDASAVLQDVRAAGGTQVPMFEAALERLGREQTPPAIAMATAQAIPVIPVEDCAATYTLCPGDGSLFMSPIAKRCPNCGTRGSNAIALTCITGGSAGATREGAGPVAAR